MTIELTHERKIRKTKRHFKRFFVDCGLTCYFVHTTNNEVVWMCERIYTADKEDCRDTTVYLLPSVIAQELREKHSVNI